VDKMLMSGADGFRINSRATSQKTLQCVAGTYAGSGVGINSISTYALSTWYHLTGTWGIDDTLKLYVNGVFQGKAYWLYSNSNSATIRIGGGSWSANYEKFHGKVDDVSIYNRVITPCEVSELYNGSLSSFSVTISGTTTICNSNSTTLTAVGGGTYLWSTTNTTTSIAVSPTTGTSYSVTATNTSGCTAVATSSVTVNQLPAIPTISVNMSTLTSSASTGNQWYLAGNQIASATATTYTVTQNGVYTVCTTDANSCSSCSAPFNFTATGIAEQSNEMMVSIFPNPSSDKVTLTIADLPARVSVFNSIGQEIVSINAITKSNELDLNGCTAGFYFVRVMTAKGTAERKIIRMK